MTGKTTYVNTFAEAFRTMLPIITGIIPTAFAYALLAMNAGMAPTDVLMSSLIVFAGSVQFISIELIRENMGYIRFALIIFLLHSRHMFFGISLFDKFNMTGKMKPLMIFWLTDESYAVLTGRSSPLPERINEGLYYIFISVIMYVSWNIGTLLGVFAAGLIRFNTAGMDFALTAMFIVIVTEQMRSYKNKLPFVIGGGAAVASLIILGPQSMLLGCCLISVILLLILRKLIETGGNVETPGGTA